MYIYKFIKVHTQYVFSTIKGRKIELCSITIIINYYTFPSKSWWSKTHDGFSKQKLRGIFCCVTSVFCHYFVVQIPRIPLFTFWISPRIHQIGGLAQWWEHSPPTHVARVRMWARAMCGLSLLLVLSLLREVFPRVFRFSPPLENQHFKIPIRPGMLQRIAHEPLARETGWPLHALSSLNNLIWGSLFSKDIVLSSA